MLFKRKFLQLALVAVVGVSVVAQQKPASDSASSVERLRAHITYLASDKLEGRRTGTAGANAAAEYIAREFSRYGLRRSNGRDLPGMSILEANSPRRYYQEFPYVSGVTLGKNNSMLFAPRGDVSEEDSSKLQDTRGASLALRLSEDWTPLGLSANGTVTNTHAIFVGYGIKATELNRDDYAGLDVRGRVAIALAGTPDGDNPHGQFGRYEDVRWKAIAARENGASALVIVSRGDSLRDEKLARLSYDNTAGDAGLPVIVVSRQAAARMVAPEGRSMMMADLEQALSGINPAAIEMNAARRRRETGKNTMSQQAVVLSLTTDIVRQNTPGMNVVGILDGTDPQLKNEAIIIGAHYDHLGRGGEGSLAPREGEIHHGADDNASGVAGMLELARIFSAQGMKPRRTLIFIAFSGEEEGLIGSNYYVNHPIVPLADTVAMINMDMIGRMKENQLIIGGVGTATEWRGWINGENVLSGPQLASNSKSTLVPFRPLTLTLNEDGFGPSDHSSFYAKQVPVLFFFTSTHDDYHKPSDTADKINYEDEVRVVSLVERIVKLIDGSDKRPTYAVAKSDGTRRSASFRVTLGLVPNYAESTDGMKIDGVRDDSPAAKAGLLAGDKITRLAGRDVKNVYDYTAALGEMKPDEEYEIEITRAGQSLKLKVTPTARK